MFSLNGTRKDGKRYRYRCRDCRALVILDENGVCKILISSPAHKHKGSVEVDEIYYSKKLRNHWIELKIKGILPKNPESVSEILSAFQKEDILKALRTKFRARHKRATLALPLQ